ncbi:MAG: hypothetical protein Q8P89_01775 [bacterium]|nr:hypothetical protein [bacterium]
MIESSFKTFCLSPKYSGTLKIEERGKDIVDLTLLYWVLIIGFGGLTAVSFLLGELFDFAGGIFGGVGDFFGDIFGSVHAHDFDTGGADNFDGGNPSPFSLRTIFAFFAGFGAGGLMGKGLGLSDIASIAPASIAGLAMTGSMWFILSSLYKQQGSTSIGATDFLNLVCRVTISIPEGKGSSGQVVVVVKGQRQNMPAVSDDGTAIPYQSEVYIKSVEGGVAIVSKV